MAVISRLMAAVPFLLSSLWVKSSHGHKSKTHHVHICHFCSLGGEWNHMMAVIPRPWNLYSVEGEWCHMMAMNSRFLVYVPFLSSACKWYYIYGGYYSKTHVYVPFLLSRRSVKSCNGCDSKTHSSCAISALQAVSASCNGCPFITHCLCTIAALQRVSDMYDMMVVIPTLIVSMQFLLFRGWVMAVISRLIVYVLFLLFRLWVILCDIC